jgi:hypothetical protein
MSSFENDIFDEINAVSKACESQVIIGQETVIALPANQFS